MKKLISICLIVVMLCSLAGCASNFKAKPILLSGAVGAAEAAAAAYSQKIFEENPYFIAKVVEVNGDHLIVEPYEGELEECSSKQVFISLADLDYGANLVGNRIFVNTTIKIAYTGSVRNQNPALINAIGIEFEEG